MTYLVSKLLPNDLDSNPNLTSNSHSQSNNNTNTNTINNKFSLLLRVNSDQLLAMFKSNINSKPKVIVKNGKFVSTYFLLTYYIIPVFILLTILLTMFFVFLFFS